MQVTNVTFSKTVQAAQYEPETVEFVAVLEEGEDHGKAVAQLREDAYAALGRKAGKVATNTSTSKSSKKEETKDDSEEETKTTKKSTSKTTKKSKASGGAKKKTTSSKKKNVPYDRSVKAHKQEFGKLLTEHFDGWKEDDDMAAAAKEASINLDGEDMMDGEGNILDSFVDAVKAAMEGEGEEL